MRWKCFLRKPFHLLTLANGGLLFLVGMAYFFFASSQSTFFRWGPGKDLSFGGLLINTWGKYIALVVFLGISKVIKTWENEILQPWILNIVYDPKTRVIRKYGKIESWWLVNGNYTFDSLYFIFSVFTYLTQIDLSLWDVLFSELTSIPITYSYLKSKQFETSEEEVPSGTYERILEKKTEEFFRTDSRREGGGEEHERFFSERILQENTEDLELGVNITF